MSTPVEISDARRLAFGGLIDYAGLFPPAALDMVEAVAGYRAARASERAWMVDRFIVPASRLVELAAQLTGTMAAGEEPWPISVIADVGDFPGFAECHGSLAAFTDELGAAAAVELVEVRLPAEADEQGVGDAAAGFARMGATTFFEMPPDDLPLDTLAAAGRDVGLGAKLRCGGLTADLFPSPGRVAAFIAGCVARSLPFKCTAGLHHPVRHTDPDTGFTHHGFLNLLVATLAAAAGEVDLEEIIADGDPASFAVERSGVIWRGRAFDASAVQAMRAEAFVGYGSCDFDEPVADLAGLAMLP